MKISEQDIKTVASLSRLRIREEEKDDVLFQLNKILTYVENLQTLDTTNVEPRACAVDCAAQRRRLF